MLEVQRQIREGRIKTPARAMFPSGCRRLSNEKGFPHEGSLDFADNRVDAGTGTYRLRAVFANPKPAEGVAVGAGLFCRVRLPLARKRC